MRSHLKFYLALMMGLFGAACSEKAEEGRVHLADFKLVVISHTKDGEILDYMALNDLTGISMIGVIPKNEIKDVYVTLRGSKRQEILQRNIAVYSISDEDGYEGRIDISFQDGAVTGCMGNGILEPSPITDSTIEEVSIALAEGRLKSERNASFEITR